MRKCWQAFCLAVTLVVCQAGFQEVRGDGDKQQFSARVENAENKLSGIKERLESLDKKMRSVLDHYKEKMHKKYQEIRAAYGSILSKLTTSYQNSSASGK